MRKSTPQLCTAHLTPQPSWPSHAKCIRCAGHSISWRLALGLPKAILGSQQGWSWGVLQKSPSTDCAGIISTSRGKEGLAQRYLLQALKKRFRACIFYPDFLFPLAHLRDLLSLSLHCLPTLAPTSLSSFLQAAKSQLIKQLGSNPPVMTANYEMSCQRLPFYLYS